MTPSLSAKRPTIASSASSRRLCEVTSRRHLDAAGLPDERAVHLVEMELRHRPDVLHQLSADVGGVRRSALDGNEIMLFFLGHLRRLTIDGADDRPQADVGRNHQDRRREAVERQSLAGEQADRGRAPEGRRGVEAPTLRPSLKITPAPRKPMPDTTWAAIRVAPSASETARAIGDEDRRPERDQRIGPQAREMLAPLPFETDRRAEAGGDEEIEAGLGERCGHAAPSGMGGRYP